MGKFSPSGSPQVPAPLWSCSSAPSAPGSAAGHGKDPKDHKPNPPVPCSLLPEVFCSEPNFIPVHLNLNLGQEICFKHGRKQLSFFTPVQVPAHDSWGSIGVTYLNKSILTFSFSLVPILEVVHIPQGEKRKGGNLVQNDSNSTQFGLSER